MSFLQIDRGASFRRRALVSMAACAVIFLLEPRPARAHPRVVVGGIGGVTLGPFEYFPTFLGGLVGEGDLAMASHITIGVAGRIQLYRHREEEDYGSWGGQQDLSLAVRLSMFDERDESRNFVGFASLRAGGGVVERIPYRDRASNELVGGYVLGGSIGVAFRWEEYQPRLRVLLSFDRPSFTTHDDKLGPAGELSLAVMTTVW